jgi:hydrogenase maturation protein HypF
MERRQITITGVVQGVGFRPFLQRLATSHGLSGWTQNGPDGVWVEIQGPPEAIAAFLHELPAAAPPQAAIAGIIVTPQPVEPPGVDGFVILPSRTSGPIQPVIPADLALCDDCAAEITDPGGRRFRYPFTNCTQCGPRYTIIASLPYDRPRTSMADFPLCPACEQEYGDTGDRRYHAQPIACPACGPHLWITGPDGRPTAEGEAALTAAVAALQAGEILALKGLGGFQLLVDARDDAAVTRLRARKRRPAKPFAVMVPSLAALAPLADIDAAAAAWLTAVSAPIVLLPRHPGGVADSVAPDNPYLGVMLPYAPLHRLLLDAFGAPVVCTSGNLSEEPLCTDNADALVRLGPIADRFLLHDRPIVRPVDDSVLRPDEASPVLLRRARGFAPLPIPLGRHLVSTVALGGHLKNTVGLSLGNQAILSQHLGDLGTLAAATLQRRTVEDLVALYAAKPERLACDQHPDYASTRLAETLAEVWELPLHRLQHHHAHVAAVMAEHGLDGPVLGLAWDGSGHGPDGTVWGGEALLCEGTAYRRVSHLRPFPLAGGEAAMRDPRRAALGLLFAAGGTTACQAAADWFPPQTRQTLTAAMASGGPFPVTSSMGRLFDAVAALLGFGACRSFEGEAAMALEFACRDGQAAPYPLPISPTEPAVADWGPLLTALQADMARGEPRDYLASRFHETLAAYALAVARLVGCGDVVLAGGCFQNRRLTTRIGAMLAEAGFRVYRAQRVPPNDGGLALGQLWLAGQAGEA